MAKMLEDRSGYITCVLGKIKRFLFPGGLKTCVCSTLLQRCFGGGEEGRGGPGGSALKLSCTCVSYASVSQGLVAVVPGRLLFTTYYTLDLPGHCRQKYAHACLLSYYSPVCCTYHIAGKYAEALNEYTKAISFNPTCPAYHSNRAITCIKLFRFEQVQFLNRW